MPDVLEHPARMRALWDRVLNEPYFQDAPYKVETNSQGQLLLTRHKPQHSFAQTRILRLLDDLAPEDGESTVELAVETPDGVKVPDVVWMSDGRVAQIPEGAGASPLMPELCVEVLSKGNTKKEMADKVALYLGAGAQEVWIVEADGGVTVYDADGERTSSALAPSFPKRI